MQEQFLGDSYDIVKRFWADSLDPIAPLYAHPGFVPEELRPDYRSLTSIRVLDEQLTIPERPFGLLLDPDTGVCIGEPKKRQRLSHISLSVIAGLEERLSPKYVICFDQSYSHQLDQKNRKLQMAKKIERLRGYGLHSFYYASHAPFLFVAGDPAILGKIRSTLLSRGIPEKWFEGGPKQQNT